MLTGCGEKRRVIDGVVYMTHTTMVDIKKWGRCGFGRCMCIHTHDVIGMHGSTREIRTPCKTVFVFVNTRVHVHDDSCKLINTANTNILKQIEWIVQPTCHFKYLKCQKP